MVYLIVLLNLPMFFNIMGGLFLTTLAISGIIKSTELFIFSTLLIFVIIILPVFLEGSTFLDYNNPYLNTKIKSAVIEKKIPNKTDDSNNLYLTQRNIAFTLEKDSSLKIKEGEKIKIVYTKVKDQYFHFFDNVGVKICKNGTCLTNRRGETFEK